MLVLLLTLVSVCASVEHPFCLVGERSSLSKSKLHTMQHNKKNLLLTNSLALMTDYKIEFPMSRFCYSWAGCGLGVLATIAAGDLDLIIHPLSLQSKDLKGRLGPRVSDVTFFSIRMFLKICISMYPKIYQSQKTRPHSRGVQLTSFGQKNVTSLTRGPNRPPLVQKTLRH